MLDTPTTIETLGFSSFGQGQYLDCRTLGFSFMCICHCTVSRPVETFCAVQQGKVHEMVIRHVRAESLFSYEKAFGHVSILILKCLWKPLELSISLVKVGLDENVAKAFDEQMPNSIRKTNLNEIETFFNLEVDYESFLIPSKIWNLWKETNFQYQNNFNLWQPQIEINLWD